MERDIRWREFHFGEWEGLTWEEIVARVPGALPADRTAAKRYAPPGGETFSGVRARVAAALDDIRRSRADPVLVVTHAGPLHAMLNVLFGEQWRSERDAPDVVFVPAGISRVAFENGAPRLVAVNQTPSR